MKRVFFLSFVLLFDTISFAQTTDTVDSRYDSCYYTHWYDTCQCFLNGQIAKYYVTNAAKYSVSSIGEIDAFPNTTNSPIQVKGGLAMVVIPENDYRNIFHYPVYTLGYSRLPEYIILYQYISGKDSMVVLDSARWDTITPKIMRVPLSANMDSFVYCYAYMAYFDSSITVDSTFYIAGTCNSNQLYGQSDMYIHTPTFYFTAGIQPCHGCTGNYPSWTYNDGWLKYDETYEWDYNAAGGWAFGGVLPLVDMNDLNVQASNEDAGRVIGGGRFARNTPHDITAVANPGYHFLQWTDSVTDVTRTVQLTQDTLFTATFLENDIHVVSATSNNDMLGMVSGSGYYLEGVDVTLTAIPADSCYFVMWTDSVTENPRHLTVTQDTSFTAIFARQEYAGISDGSLGAFGLQPNPANDKVTVTVPQQLLSGNAQVSLVMTDTQGRTVLQQRISETATTIALTDLSSGLYYVTLQTDQGCTTQKLVVK